MKVTGLFTSIFALTAVSALPTETNDSVHLEKRAATHQRLGEQIPGLRATFEIINESPYTFNVTCHGRFKFNHNDNEPIDFTETHYGVSRGWPANILSFDIPNRGWMYCRFARPSTENYMWVYDHREWYEEEKDAPNVLKTDALYHGSMKYDYRQEDEHTGRFMEMFVDYIYPTEGQ